MIAVSCREQERAVARELFELFKTPWTFHDKGSAYDVILVSDDSPVAALDGRLIIVFGASERPDDRALGLAAGTAIEEIELDRAGVRIPLYGATGAISRSQDGSGSAFVMTSEGDRTIVRCGYNLFGELEFVLSRGQPPECSCTPTVDLHIDLLRSWILRAGLRLAEIPPHPPGCELMACLTHDVDFLGIRRHRLDSSVLGFLYRALLGTVIDFLRGRRSARQLITNWQAALSLPLVHLGRRRDFWMALERYLEVEAELPSTFYFIPFRDRPGRGRDDDPPAPRRRVRYGVDEVGEIARTLLERGSEVGVHAIDAWTDAELGREELLAVAREARRPDLGVRVHWLYFDEESFARLDRAGFVYDSTFGYNETVGFRAGTAQVYRPLASQRLLELPLHVQDTALLFPRRMHLSEREAVGRVKALVEQVRGLGGVLTISWHDRSLAPERQWDAVYAGVLAELRAQRASVRTARGIVDWFARRREVDLQGRELAGADLEELHGPAADGREFVLRLHRPQEGACALDIPIGRGGLNQAFTKTAQACRQ